MVLHGLKAIRIYMEEEMVKLPDFGFLTYPNLTFLRNIKKDKEYFFKTVILTIFIVGRYFKK